MSSSKVIVAMSGGVDSSVSALLLKQQGYEVEGLFMKNWEEDDTASYCSADEDVKDAKTVCDTLGIKLHTVNFAHEYWENVFTYFLEEYKKGRTPNPDILCNREIKFKLCMDYAMSLGADLFATGHYAKTNHHQLIKGFDRNKDQTYFIYTLTKSILEKVLFPIGELAKSDVRKIAEEASLITYNKKDSTGICFIGERRFKTFLSHYLPAKPGVIQTIAGKIMGKHDGLMYYTLGQRQGIKIGGQKVSTGEPWYVVKKDLANNILIVAQGHDHPDLFSKMLICTKTHWINGETPPYPFHCKAKTRYRQEEQSCKLTLEQNDSYRIEFEQPQWAVTPGQSIVFYQNEVCLGGGIIDESF